MTEMCGINNAMVKQKVIEDETEANSHPEAYILRDVDIVAQEIKQENMELAGG